MKPKGVAYFATTEYAVALVKSFKQACEENYGSARATFTAGMRVTGGDLTTQNQQLLFLVMKSLIGARQIDFLEWVTKSLIAMEYTLKGEAIDWSLFLKPYNDFISYINSRDEAILEKLHQEYRELVLEMVEIYETQVGEILRDPVEVEAKRMGVAFGMIAGLKTVN